MLKKHNSIHTNDKEKKAGEKSVSFPRLPVLSDIKR